MPVFHKARVNPPMRWQHIFIAIAQLFVCLSPSFFLSWSKDKEGKENPSVISHSQSV